MIRRRFVLDIKIVIYQDNMKWFVLFWFVIMVIWIANIEIFIGFLLFIIVLVIIHLFIVIFCCRLVEDLVVRFFILIFIVLVFIVISFLVFSLGITFKNHHHHLWIISLIIMCSHRLHRRLSHRCPISWSHHFISGRWRVEVSILEASWLLFSIFQLCLSWRQWTMLWLL